MPKIAVVAVTDPDYRLLLLDVPFLPQAGKPITVREKNDDKGRRAESYMLVDLLRYEIITDAPGESGAVYSGHKIR